MTQHTPGPWTATPYRDSRFSHPITRFHIDGPQNQVFLADVYDGNGHHPAEANARLIAKAPEMVAFIRQVAFEPIGDAADASHAEVLDLITEKARVLLREIEGS